MGQQKKQQIEEEKARLEQEKLEQERQEIELREQQRQEAARAEEQRQEEQRAEQTKLEREREQEERRIRERVVQARRERDFAQQAVRAKEVKDIAAQRQREQETASQREQKEHEEASLKQNNNAGQRNGLGLAFSPETHSYQPVDEYSQHREVPSASKDNSSSEELSRDHRSPLARNPSNEELHQQPSSAQPLPDSTVEAQSQPRSPKTPKARDQRPPWKPRVSSLPSESPVEISTGAIESRFQENLQNMTIQEEPKSRFSTTTYATTAYNDTPPHTPEYGPDSPSGLSSTQTPDSILNRRRPIPNTIGSKTKTPRKPTPSEIAAPTSHPAYAADSPGLPDSEPRVKILPKAPVGQKVDQVKTLQAKQDALRRRKNNIETVIRELTDVVQPSSIAYDKASRAEIKKTVEQLKRELAEVVKDEHETGLKLHRAWKRHDDFADFEPTSIWVRRVTH